MNLELLLKLLAVLQFVTLTQNSHVQDAKKRIRTEVRSALGHHYHQHHHHHNNNHHAPQQQQRSSSTHSSSSHHQHHHHWQQDGQRVHRVHNHRNRWSGRRHSIERHHFTGWSAWSACGSACVKRRERFCKAKRKCGYTKHVEEHKCWNCHPEPVWHPTATHVAAPTSHQQQQQQQQQQQTIHHGSDTPHTIVINAAAASSGPQFQVQQLQPTTASPVVHAVHPVRMPVLQEFEASQHNHNHNHHYHNQHHLSGIDDEDGVEETSEENDFYVLNDRPKYKKRRKTPILIDPDLYADLAAEEPDDTLDDDDDDDDLVSNGVVAAHFGPVRSMRTRSELRKLQKHRQHRWPHKRPLQRAEMRQRNLASPAQDGIEGDTFQYEDFDMDQDTARAAVALESQYSDSYEDNDYVDYRNATKEKATPDALIPKHRRIYSKWSRWTKCSPKCTTRRYKKCRVREQCGREVLREIAYCYTEGSFCQQWLQAQVQKSPPYELRPVAASRRRDISGGDGAPQSNAIVSDYIMNGKGYRGPEYTPMKLKCGIAPIRSNKRNMYNMLKIIGGKAARRGEWPWQVAIFNRFKEAFCGGTLIAPQWVLTAAHCVRKVLYVRIGEHNLDYEDGTELQLRVLKSFKHPNFDKKTVDSDVALLRLPKPVNSTTWIGFSCLPHPYQPLPKNIDCTVIGWGKRRNRDIAGTSVLHQAEVPIIQMENCRSVYHDYTITKNMFCAGHKRGRIDTCAGDSGGPLLCRDTTKPNHPWTIFGITSFGDGCAKRNKFGIYAKVPNYVDWVWSVVNCNGNCKLHQRSNYGGN